MPSSHPPESFLRLFIHSPSRWFRGICKAAPLILPEKRRGSHARILLLGALLFPTVSARAQLTNLSQFTNPSSYVREFRASAPTGRILFDEDVNESGTFSPDVRNVFSVVPNQPATRIRLNNLVGTNAERIRGWKVSPDGTRVAMLGDLIGNGLVQLFTASTTQPGTQVRLDTNTASGQNYEAFEFEFTPDSSRVVFRARINGAFRLLSAPAGGGSAVNVSPVSPNDVRDFRLLQNGTQVIYRADLFDGTDELFLASVATAGTSLRLTEVAAGNAEVGARYEISPNGTDLVFAVNLFAQSRDQLLRAAINPSGSQSGITFAGVTNSRIRALLPPEDNGRVQFIADFDTVNRNKVYAKIPTILDPFVISDHTTNPSGTITASSLARTQDGSRVLYLGNLTNATRIDLYSASVGAAGTQTRLSAPLLASSEIFRFAITPDSSRAVYSGDLEENGQVDLYSASTTAPGTQVKLYTRQTSESVIDWTLSPDGSRVLFTVLRTAPTATLDVWSAPVDGGAPATLAAPFTGLGVTAQTKVGFTPSGIGIVGGNQLFSFPSPVGPSISLLGSKRIRTTAAKVILRGRTAGDEVRQVEISYRGLNKRPVLKRIPVKPNGTWRFVFRPAPGRTPVQFRAVDAGGLRSAPAKAVVIKKTD